MTQIYATPQAFDKAIKQRAKLLAEQQGADVGMILRNYFFDRLTARIFHDDPDGWLLKGGQALLVRYPRGARFSRDIDLQRPTENVEEALSALRRAAALDLGDFFVFTPAATREHADEAGGARQAFTIALGARDMGTLTVDVVAGRHPVGTPEVVDLTPGIPLLWPDDWPRIQLYPLVDHLADKICAMYEHRRGIASTRFRDLADILLVSQRERLDGAAVRLALSTEVRRRIALGTDVRLPARFTVPDPGWRLGYPKAAQEVIGLQGCRSLAEAQAAADAFLTPLLSGPPPGTWQPGAARWVTPPPARPAEGSPVA
ncbi:nucleotidyl transferase AbiEii/AbiGii toxin family protein [Sphaerisporangium sp. B11E5]|uniref:nucleotidyl transferase AbiEii/AbiGii toxin family protein n=1 Tax=Sphaerisporangium sp. B11E5 TaxID=3153563 RepID=UPI00325E229B